MKPIIDPRDGDIEDDASSTKQRSLFSLAGSLLAEISLPKLAVAWVLLIGLPGVALGLAGVAGVVDACFAAVSREPAPAAFSTAGGTSALAIKLPSGRTDTVLIFLGCGPADGACPPSASFTPRSNEVHP